MLVTSVFDNMQSSCLKVIAHIEPTGNVTFRKSFLICYSSLYKRECPEGCSW